MLKLSFQNMYDVGKIVTHLEEFGSNLRSAPRISGQIHAFAAMHVNKVSKFDDKKKYMITAPLKKMMEIIQGKFNGHTTRDITVNERDSRCILNVGSESLDLDRRIWQYNPWVEKITDLRGVRPKIAVDLMAMERALDERIRVNSILDWLDSQY